MLYWLQVSSFLGKPDIYIYVWDIRNWDFSITISMSSETTMEKTLLGHPRHRLWLNLSSCDWVLQDELFNPHKKSPYLQWNGFFSYPHVRIHRLKLPWLIPVINGTPAIYSNHQDAKQPWSHTPMALRPAAQVSLKEMQLDTVLNCAKSKVARQGDDTWTKNWEFFPKNGGCIVEILRPLYHHCIY